MDALQETGSQIIPVKTFSIDQEPENPRNLRIFPVQYITNHCGLSLPCFSSYALSKYFQQNDRLFETNIKDVK